MGEADEEESIPTLVAESSLEALGRERTQVVLGGPGNGKSTLLLYTMVTLCNPARPEASPLPSLQSCPVPFLIELRQYVLKGMPGILDYVVENAREEYGITLTRESLEGLLERPGQALFLFDGLDEVFSPSDRRRALQQFKVFARSYENASLVVTSPIAGYDPTELGVARFEHYMLLEFTLQQVRDFVPKWYRYYTLEGTQRDAAGLIQRITDSRRLTELAGNPLLLTMMAVIYKHHDLPEERFRLYERCTEVLLEDWDVKRKGIDLAELPLDVPLRTLQKTEILQRVSMYMLEHGQSGAELNAIGYQALLQILADYLQSKFEKSSGEAEAIAEGILAHLRERTYVLAEIGERIFGFVHRTFMEYFAARQCLADFNARKANYKWLNDLFAKNWRKDEWQEVLLLLIAMLAGQQSPVQEVLEHLRTRRVLAPPFHLAFMARCAAEARDSVNQAWAGELAADLAEALSVYAGRRQDESSQRFVETGLAAFSALAPTVNLPQRARAVIKSLSQGGPLAARKVAWQMGFALRSRHERLEYALAALWDTVEVVCRAAIDALAREWPGHDRVQRALLSVARWHNHSRVRRAALEALARLQPRSSEALTAIEQQFPDSPYTHASWLLRHLTGHWGSDERVVPLLLRIPAVPGFFADRQALSVELASAIVYRWRSSPDLLATLKHRATTATDSLLRCAMIMALSRICLGISLTTYTRDQSGSLRFFSRAILSSGEGDPAEAAVGQVLSLLRKHAEQDGDATVRAVSLVSLAAATPSNGDLGQFVRTRAALDPNPSVRISALFAAARAGRDDQVVRSLVLERGTNDPDPDVRANALQMAANLWSDDATTRATVLERACCDERPLVRSAVLTRASWLWNQDAQVRSVVFERAREDDAYEVRSAAFRAAANFWWHDSALVDLAWEWMRNGEDASIRQLALQISARALNWDTRRLLTRDVDGARPWIDPHDAIDTAHVSRVARKMKLPEEEVRRRYEALAEQFSLKLEWQSSIR